MRAIACSWPHFSNIHILYTKVYILYYVYIVNVFHILYTVYVNNNVAFLQRKKGMRSFSKLLAIC